MRDLDFKRQCLDSNSGQDFISNLPQSLKDNILMRLNIIEAVRTCILSKRWRYAWNTMPKLVICMGDVNEIDKDRNNDGSKLVNSLLSHHEGPITNFILSIKNFQYEDLDRWIHVLGNKGVKDLCFNFDMMDSCDIPSSFLSCLPDLTKLKFSSCTLDVSQLFRGFKLLRTLELNVGRIDGSDFERLVSRCPLLQDLTLVNMFDSFGNLVIQSQSLEKFSIKANFNNLVLETPKLFVLSVVLTNTHSDTKSFKNEVYGSYETCPRKLLRDFHVFSIFVEACHIKATRRKLPIKFNYLVRLVVRIDVSKKDNLVAALFLFKSSPKLQDLHVELYNMGGLRSDSKFKRFWESEATDSLFNNLKTVIIRSDFQVAPRSLIGIIKFVLRTAPILEEMTVRHLGVSFMVHAMKNPPMLLSLCRIGQGRVTEKEIDMDETIANMLEVLKLPRLSKKATITFEASDIFDGMEQSATPDGSSA